MNNIDFSETKKLQIEPRIVKQMSLATIRSFPDAIVELITNSDDSYKRLEQNNYKCSGEIIVSIERLKYGKVKELTVVDFAEGMDRNRLEDALRFGGETSGLQEGKSVRGLFGRGLKETIVALGKGTIYTIKDCNVSIAELWWDEKEGMAKYRISKESYIPGPEDIQKLGIKENGTFVEILVSNEAIKCPDYKTLLPQISNHFALRDINSCAKRKVSLNFTSPEKGGLKITTPISYQVPKGNEVFNKPIKLPDFDDELSIKIFESDIELDSSYNNPYAKSGLLIKSGGAILDNQLFRFSTERAGCFFFGEVVCNAIYQRVKNGDYGLVDPNRCGIEWKHRYCQILQNEIEKLLQPLIEKKKEELSKSKPATKISERTKKILNKVCQLLNRFAKLELEKEPSEELDLKEDEQIKDIFIKPQKANVEINKERWFSVYIPFKSIGVSPSVIVTSSNNEKISVLDPMISNFHPHSKRPTILMSKFRIIGREIGATGIITCLLEESRATTEVNVVPEKPIGPKGKRKRELHIPKGGFFNEIVPDNELNPPQRGSYENGKIRIFVSFPMVKHYLDEKLEPRGSEGKAILAELIGDVFCRFIARARVDKGAYPIIPGAEIDTFNRALNDIQKEYLHRIHEIMLGY